MTAMTASRPGQQDREIVNPATGEVVARVPDQSPDDVAAMVARAQEAQPGWNSLGFAARGKLLKALNSWLITNKDRVINALSEETGKSYDDALRTDIFLAAQSIGYWAKHAEGFLKERKVPVGALLAGKGVKVRYEPLGVVGIIAPWNYPILVAVADAMPALMAGNAVVIKPSEFSPLASKLVFEEGMRAVGFPEGVCQVATGGGATGAALVELADMIQFTGSAATGRKILARAGERLIPASAELGGKDPLLVLADANLERAANCAIQWGICNSGQTCVGTERIYVEAPVYDAFVAKVVEKIDALRQGPAGAPATVEVGAMTTEAQVETVERHIDEAVAAGARVLRGGKRAAVTGRFFEPTVLVDVTNEMACMQEETFGPTLPIMKVADADEAIRMANDSPYGLNASVFTKDLKKGARIARQLEAGQVCVNDAAVSISAFGAPMTGWKQSGLGGRHGEQGIRKYCATQAVMVARLVLAREPYMYPYTEKRTHLVEKLLGVLFGHGR
ncbi:aldehyde dehydrogenase family protein [Janibacter sp. G1551]|uniref:aldehyde dehydrogenase family protein n=1 Tax=Janibacter sp. G1551 TaxID=3420440 RepID=UPI003D0809FB